MGLLTVVFIFCVAALLYIYVGYPLLCRLLTAFGRQSPTQSASENNRSYTPSVTILIAAYNEAAHIQATVRNKLELDYPTDRLEFIVVSDESPDGTDELVSALQSERMRLLRQQPRAGKTSALNLAVPSIQSEIIVFSDANSLYTPTAMRHLVAPLTDPSVGYVTGRMVYKAPDGSLAGEGCSTYMRYENLLREWETQLGSIVGVDGGIDAVRRDLYTSMRADQLPDFVLPLSVRERGHRVVYTPRALLYEDALAEAADDFRMRVRVSLRAWHGLKDKAALLNPLRLGIFAWQLFSHKPLRYLAPVFQLGALAANLALAPTSWFWLSALILQVVFYAGALAGHLLRRRSVPRLLSLPYYFCLVNAAAAVALVRFLRGEKQVIWQPRT